MRIGRCAASLPDPADVRRAIALVAHVLHEPLEALWDMELKELVEWAEEATGLCKRLYGTRR